MTVDRDAILTRIENILYRESSLDFSEQFSNQYLDLEAQRKTLKETYHTFTQNRLGPPHHRGDSGNRVWQGETWQLQVSNRYGFCFKVLSGLTPEQAMEAWRECWQRVQARSELEAALTAEEQLTGLTEIALQVQRDNRSRIDWDKQPLGKQTDVSLAQQLGVTKWLVSAQRCKRGIPRYRRICWDQVALGKVSDYQLAKLLKCCPRAVALQRAQRGIPAFHLCIITGIDWDQVPFGTMPERQLAKQLGCGNSTVRDHRIKRGLPPYSVLSWLRNHGKPPIQKQPGNPQTLPSVEKEMTGNPATNSSQGSSSLLCLEDQVCQEILTNPLVHDRASLAKLRLLWVSSPLAYQPKDSRERILKRLIQDLHRRVLPEFQEAMLRSIQTFLAPLPPAPVITEPKAPKSVLPDDLLDKVPRIQALLPALPPLEAAILDCFFFQHQRQIDIAAHFKLSQPTVCYRIQRAMKRLRFLLQVPEVDIKRLEKDLERVLSDPVDVRIMILFWQAGCQSAVAKQLSTSQGMVRHRIERSLRHLELFPQFSLYTDWFRKIQQNLNLTREVRTNKPTGLVEPDKA